MIKIKSLRPPIIGEVASGSGNGTAFTQLSWAKQQFKTKLGIDPHPGTLNLLLQDETSLENWRDLSRTEGHTIYSPSEKNCNARCYPVYIANRFSAAIIYPEVDNYPASQIELISSISLRQHLSLHDKDPLLLEVMHPLQTSAVIFDLDGTLVDSVDAFYILARRSAAGLGHEISRAQVTESLNYGKHFWEPSLPVDLPNRREVIDRLKNNAKRLWPEIAMENVSVFPDVAQTLSKLKSGGFQLGIVTALGGESLEILYRTGVRELFDAVITGSDVSKRKPHPEGLFKCLDSLETVPENAAYVGDTSIDMQAGLAAGMTVIGVLSGAGNPAQLCAAGAHRIFNSHVELPDVLHLLSKTSATD